MGCEHSCIARPIHSQPDAEVRLIAFLPPLASRVPLITNRRGKKCFLRIFSEQWQLHRTCLYRTRGSQFREVLAWSESNNECDTSYFR